VAIRHTTIVSDKSVLDRGATSTVEDFVFLGAALAILVAVPSLAMAQKTDLRREIDSLNRAMERAFNAGNLMAVSRFYADDAKLMGPRNDDVQGRAAIDRYWTGIRGAKSWKLDVLEVGGDRNTVYQVGRSTLVTTGANGDQSSISRFMVIWKRQPNGQMKIAIDFYHW
jgi:ketosteroid isomerase-like protein